MGYNQYLESEHWCKVRKAKLQQFGYCDICGSDRLLHVHHRNYDNIGSEKLSDLRVLCKWCHEKEHGIIRKGESASIGELLKEGITGLKKDKL